MIAMPKQDIRVPYSAVRTVVILDRIPKDTKGRVLLCLQLDGCAHRPVCSLYDHLQTVPASTL